MRRLAVLLLVAGCWSTSAPPAAPLRPTAGISFDVRRATIRGGVRALDTNGTHVVVYTWDDELIGFTANGDKAFARKLPLPDTSSVGVELAGDTAIVSTSAAVIGVSARLGTTRWRRELDPDVAPRVSVVGDTVWIDSDAEPQTLSVRFGTELVRHRPPAPARTIEASFLGEDRIRLTATEGGRTLWTTEFDGARARMGTHHGFGDTTMYARKHGDGSTIVALDSATGRTRWTYELDQEHLFRHAFRGNGVYWVMLTNVSAVIDGSQMFRWLALTEDGKLLHTLDTPEVDAVRCGGGVSWDSAGGVLAVSAPTRTADGGCDRQVLSIITPVRR